MQIEIIDVFLLKRTESKFYTEKRPFHILTKRISGYTDMTFEDISFRITPDTLLYIPANIDYVRQSDGYEEIIAIHFNILNRKISRPLMINVDEEKCNRAFGEIYTLWSEKKKATNTRVLLFCMNISAQ